MASCAPMRAPALRPLLLLLMLLGAFPACLYVADPDPRPDAGQDAGTDAGEDAGEDPDGGDPDAGENPDGETVSVRVLAANLTSGNYSSYDPGHGQRIMQGVSPDIVLVQEFKYGQSPQNDVSGFVEDTFPGFDFYREPIGGNGDIPNGVISRWPILEAGKWDDPEVDNREFVWARIDIPGEVDLWVVSLHLLTRNASTRRAEADALVAYIETHIPEADYLIVGGDLNTDSRGESAFRALAAVVDVEGPHPVDQNGAQGTNASRAKPYDHVFADWDLRPYQVPTVIGENVFEAGLVVDTRTYTPLSDLAPAQYGDSGATNMQHMGVVKDFLVPVD